MMVKHCSLGYENSLKIKIKKGEKIFFRCKLNCPKMMYVLLHADTDKASIFISNGKHQHVEQIQKNSLSGETWEKVVDLLNRSN